MAIKEKDNVEDREDRKSLDAKRIKMTDTGRRWLNYLKGVHGFRGVNVVLTQLSAVRLSGTDFFYHLRSKL